MGKRLQVFLTAEEERTWRELRRATTVPQRVKDRAEVVRMNARGDYVETIAAYFDWPCIVGRVAGWADCLKPRVEAANAVGKRVTWRILKPA